MEIVGYIKSGDMNPQRVSPLIQHMGKLYLVVGDSEAIPLRMREKSEDTIFDMVGEGRIKLVPSAFPLVEGNRLLLLDHRELVYDKPSVIEAVVAEAAHKALLGASQAIQLGEVHVAMTKLHYASQAQPHAPIPLLGLLALYDADPDTAEEVLEEIELELGTVPSSVWRMLPSLVEIRPLTEKIRKSPRCQRHKSLIF